MNASERLAHLRSRYENHPILRRNFDKQMVLRATNRLFKIVSAEDVLAEKICLSIAILEANVGNPDNPYQCIDIPDAVLDQGRVMTSQAIDRAVPYLWASAEIRKAAAALKIPDHRLSRNVLPFPDLYWTWPEDLVIAENYPQWNDVGCVAVVLSDVGIGITATQIFTHWSSPMGDIDRWFMIPGAICKYGEMVNPQIKPFLAMLSFLKSRFLQHEIRKPERSIRKEIARLGQVEMPAVNFVDLRYPQREEAERSGQNKMSIDRKYRWLVSGHIRAQWYPSSGSHDLIWIDPYIKGPDHAPMKPSAYRVIR